jgi:protein-disulfide isomerase
MNKGTAIVAIVIAFLGGVLVGNLVGSSKGGSEEMAEVSNEAGPEVAGAAAIVGDVERVKAPVTKDQPVKGPEDALVTIVEISDFQCPFCSKVGPTMSRIRTEYKDKVRIAWRNNPLPFHKDAPLAHQAAMEAFAQGGSDKFWAMHDKLFENQKELTRANLDKWGAELGLDKTKFAKALDTMAHKAVIDADQAFAASIGARGTPHFVINGRKLSGAQPFDAFKTVIDEELKKAEDLLKKGVEKKYVYAEFLRNAKSSPTAAAGAEGERPARPQPDPNAVYKVPVGDEPSKGPSDALVTIVQFSDFECPFCGRVEGTVNEIMSTYKNDVRVVWMNNPLPFHKNATPAAQASLEAFAQGGAKKFWAFHAKMFENQRELTRENLEKWGKEIGLNAGKLKAALDGNTHQEAINKSMALAKSLGASGTPAFFINGRNLRGAQPFPAFKAVIDEELAKAKAKVAAGTPRSKIYEETIKDGKTSPQMLAAPAGAAPAAQRPAAPDANKIYNIAVPADAPIKGSKTAKVVIQEFSDFQCPFCSRVGPTIKQIEQTYGNKVAIVWRDYPLPFHQNAPVAHQAAREVFEQGGSEKFWKFHDKLFEGQRELTRENIEKWAQELGGINVGKLKAALDSGKHKARMDADMAAIAKAGAQIGTPSFFINGKLLQGAQPFDAFKTEIDAALAK